MKKRRKHSISVITAAVISMISIFTPLTNALPVGGVMAMADEPDNNSGNGAADTISSGQVDVGDDKVINWTINTENNTLTFKGEGAIPDYAYNDRKPWGEQFLSGPDTNYIPLEKVKKIVIGEGITRVGNYALKDFIVVTEVELPESLSEIGDFAFNGCKALTSIMIPEKVETIGDDAFSECNALSNIMLPKNLTHIGKTALYKTALESVDLPSGLTLMGESVFSDCEKLEAVRFNGNIKLEKLPASTFSRCAALSLVELPKKLKTIGKYAFNECKALKGIDLPDTLEEIGENAFNTSGLVSLEIPSNVQKLGRDSFGSCAGLKRVALGDNITERGNGVFSGCSDPEKYMLYSGTKEEFQNKLSGLNAVANSTDFTVIYNYKKGVVNASIEAGSGIGKATIKWDKYYDIDPAKDGAGYKIEMKNENGEWIDVPNDQITDNELDSEIKKLEPGKEYVFKVLAYYNYQSSQIKTAESEELSFTPSNVIISGTIGENDNITWEISPAEESGKSILTISGDGDMPDYSDNTGQPWKGNWTYNGQTYPYSGISRIIIKDGITGIGDSTFLSLSGVTEVTLPKSLKTIDSYAFRSCRKLGSLILPESLKTIGSYAFDSCEKLSSLTLKEGLESIDEFAFSETALTNVNIPKSVKSIGRYAFAFNEGLETVSLNEGLETVATCAFQQCPIKEITIPASVKEIGTTEGSPFCACPELVSIRVAEGNNCVKAVGDVLFSKDGKTLIQYPAGGAESTYSVPSGTEKIAPYAFAGCMRLKNLLIPEGVKSIGDCAFMGNEMESVNIPDSATELGLLLFAQGSAGKVILPKNLDKDHLMPFLFMAAEVKDVYYPGSKEEWQALEDSFRNISDEGKLEILKTMLMGGEWKDPETEEEKQYLIGMYDNQFGALTLLDYYMDESTGKLLSANLICNYREDLSDKGYEISDIPEQIYQGSPVKPAVTVRNEEGVLYPGCYVTEFKDNNKAGTATVTVKGTGRYGLSGNGAYGLYLTKNYTIKEQATVPTDPADDTPVLTPSDNKPMDIRTETVGDGSGGEFKVEYAHQIPFFGKGKITPALFGDKFTVLHGNTAYKVTKIKVNKKKKRIQITGLEGANKATVKAIKKATKGDKGMSFEENPYYVKDTDTVIAKFKKNGNLKSVKITINNKGYKAKKDEFEYDKAAELIRFKGANLDGSYKVSTHN